MKSVLISIKPKWCELIASGEKTIEVRKNSPKIEVPFKCYIYCTNSNTKDPHKILELHRIDGNIVKLNGKVIGEFVCDKVVRSCGWRLRGNTQQCAKRTVAEAELPKLACLSIDEIVDYAGSENREVVGLHISELKIYDKPKELSEFCAWKKCNSCKTSGYESTACMYDEDCKAPAVVTRPPQSWCYVEELPWEE